MRLRLSPRSGLNIYVLAMPLLIVLFLAALAPAFLSPGNLQNIAVQIAPLAIATLGQLLVALVAGIDLSVGSVVSLATCIMAATDNTAVGILTALAVGGLIGLTNGLAVAIGRIHPIIATLATMTIVQGIALYWLPSAGGRTPESFVQVMNGVVAGIPASLIVALALYMAISWVLRSTPFGLHLLAAGAHAQNAYFNGVADRRMIVSAYVLCSLGAAVAGILLAGRIGAGDPLIGSQFSLNSITAIALGGVQFTGGIGSPLGALLGTLTLGLMRNGMNLLGIDAFLQSAITGLMLLFAISFQRRKVVGF